MLIGAFFVCMALTGVVYSQSVALWSDKLLDRRKLIFVAMICGGLACIGFGLVTSYALAILIAVTLFSLSFPSASQILALSREFADQQLPLKQGRLFNSIVRSTIALAWVAGPPLGFLSFYHFGIHLHYQLMGLCYFVVAVLAVLFLPKLVVLEQAPQTPPVLGRGRWAIVVGVVAFSLLYATNQGYVRSLPLYLDQYLQVETVYAGYLLGLAAAIEIPLMIIAGWLAGRGELLPLIRVGAIAAVVFYFGIWLADDLWQLFVLQFLNSTFIGFVSGLGASWFQDKIPGRAGSASALYISTSSAGTVLGSIFIAVVGELYDYRQIYLLNAFVAAIALVLLYVISKIEKREATD